MIEINNLQKKFVWENSQTTIFHNLNLQIQTGAFIAIIGPSWSGKSTFLNMLSWIDRVFDGEIILDGYNISQWNEAQATAFRGKNISYIFQNFKLIDNLTVEENIDLIIEMNQLERNFSTDEILEKVGLFHKKNEYVFHLSWGECQRVAIARAFVGKTKILLADEPTGALDVENKQKIMELILSLHQSIQNTIIMITHDSEVAQLAHRVYKIQGGDLVLTSQVWI